MLHEIKEQDKRIDSTRLVCAHTNGKIYDFKMFRRLGGFIRSIYFGNISLEEAINRQD